MRLTSIAGGSQLGCVGRLLGYSHLRRSLDTRTVHGGTVVLTLATRPLYTGGGTGSGTPGIGGVHCSPAVTSAALAATTSTPRPSEGEEESGDGRGSPSAGSVSASASAGVSGGSGGGGGRTRATPITAGTAAAAAAAAAAVAPGGAPAAAPVVPAPAVVANQLTVPRKKSMKMAEIRRSAEGRVWESFRHTRETMPRTDEEGLLLCFSQGTTDYCWREVGPGGRFKEPRMLRGETSLNRMRLFGMPKGFPDTTAYGFQRFFYLSQTSSFVSNFSSSIGYQSLLNGFFLGSSPQLWMLKDLVPALLAAYLANRVVSYENRPKFWFTVSVFMNNVSVISDMLIPKAFPDHLLVAAILTSTVKQSSALMYFVTRAAALQHFSTHNNLAELTKKFNSFGMVNYTIATALGIVYCTYVASFTVQLVTAVCCCAINMFLAPMSMNPIAFRLLNFTTIRLVMHTYVREGRVLSPEDVSKLLGVRMLAAFPEDSADRHALIYVSPPIEKLVVRSDTLEEDVLYVNNNDMFMLALWAPSPVPLSVRECWLRWELPGALRLAERFRSFRRTFGKGKGPRKAELVFGGKRLVLLVHTKCTPRDLMTAYLLMFTATLQHATTELQLRTFLRDCHSRQEHWQREAVVLRECLRRVNWDVDLMSIDHPSFRMSDLIVPPSLRKSGAQRAMGTPPGAAGAGPLSPEAGSSPVG